MNQRHDLSAEIREDVSQVIAEELADAPSTVTEEDLKAIEDDLMGRTNQILEALSLEEMRSAGAQCSHLANIRAEVRNRLRYRRG
jgi:hypothetical protein